MFFAGQQFGRYTLVKQLGKGAYGEVWLAMRHAKFVTTKVAIKLPNTALVDFDAIRQEAILWEQASGHPNVLPIIEADEFDGQVVIVSEYASDGTLDDFLGRAGKLPMRKAVEMAIGIAQGLEFLHSRRIVHRDIKPANVLLQGDTPRLTDFGMSRVVLGNAVSLQVSGTPYYMAPEAFSRKRDRQTDIWSFGVVIYEMLTGAMPFPGDDVDQICHAVLNDKPLPMPKSIPRPLRNVILRMLEKSPADRFQSATEIREELQRLLPELPETAADGTELYDQTDAPGRRSDQKNKHSDFKRSQFVPDPAATKRSGLLSFRVLAPVALLLILIGAGLAAFYLTLPDPIPFRRGDKFGFVTWNRKPLIAPKYDLARPFFDGRALVGIGSFDESGKFSGKFGFIDASGNEVAAPGYDDADSFSEKLAKIGVRSETGAIRYGFVDRKGQTVVQPTFDDARAYSESLAAVRFQEKWGYVDRNGGAAIPFNFDDAQSFSGGLAAVRIGEKFGYINKRGEIVIQAAFDLAGPFASGRAPVKLGDRAYFIDEKGGEILNANYTATGPFFEGAALVVSGGKAGFIDPNGAQIVPFAYDGDNAYFSEGAAAVKMNGRYGYINRRGALLVPFRYLEAGPFKNKLALVRSAADGREFYISDNGTEFYEP